MSFLERLGLVSPKPRNLSEDRGDDGDIAVSEIEPECPLLEETVEFDPAERQERMRVCIADLDLVGLARLEFPLVRAAPDDPEEDDSQTVCIPCVGGAIMLTYYKYQHELGLPYPPGKISATAMPPVEALEAFFGWIFRVVARIEGEASVAQKSRRRRARTLASNIINTNDRREFAPAWDAATRMLPPSLFQTLAEADFDY